MSPEKMVRMANQIATFFDSQPEETAAGVAQHLNNFWGPDMRVALIDYVAAGGNGLAPSVIEATAQLRRAP